MAGVMNRRWRGSALPGLLVASTALALPTYPSGQTPGLSIDEALASCGS
jgi:hypothetical protein